MNIFRQLYMNHNCKIVNSDNSQIMPYTDVLEGSVMDDTPVKEKRVRLDLNAVSGLLQAMKTQYDDLIELGDLYTRQSCYISTKEDKRIKLRLKASKCYTQAEKLKIEIYKLDQKYR